MCSDGKRRLLRLLQARGRGCVPDAREVRQMNPFGHNLVWVYVKYCTPHDRTLGTSDASQWPELKAFVKWLREKRKWDALDLIIARMLSIPDAYSAHEAGRL